MNNKDRILRLSREPTSLDEATFDADNHEGAGYLFPASFAQQRMWFLDELEGGSQYNIISVKKIDGPLNVALLEKSFNTVVQRHECLRTTFVSRSGELFQFVARSRSLSLGFVDFRNMSQVDSEKALERAISREAGEQFNLRQGPLLRVKIFQLDEQEHFLVLVIHHIVADGWSRSVIFRELTTLYESYARGQASPLPDLQIQYADFSVWQHQWLQGVVLEQQLDYWRQRLAGLEPLSLPTDHPRPAAQSFRGSQHPFLLDSSLTGKLKALSTGSGMTLFMTLIAAFQVLLHRYSGQDDIVVGTPVAGRNRLELEDLIGLFVNTLVIRSDLSGDPTFEELLKKVRFTAIEAFTHQDLPFEKLVEELLPARDLSRNPIFQVMFSMQNTPNLELSLGSSRVTDVQTKRDDVKFDLALDIAEIGGALHGRLNFSCDLFEASTIARMAAHFKTLLQGIVAQPSTRLSELPILTQDERQLLLTVWNSNQIDSHIRPQLIHDLITEQAARIPDSIALVQEEQSLSYAELNHRANQLAHYLKGLGVGPETIVGICMERRLNAVVGLLGILKAGAAYVPLDPEYPDARLEIIVRDSEVSVLLASPGLSARFKQFRGRFVCLQQDWETICTQSAENPEVAVENENLAYVIYTSGSTGMPKGVMIEHGSVAALVAWAGRQYSKEELSGVLASTSLSFDLSVFELFVPLALGGSVILADSILQLPDLSTKNQVSLINTVPSAMAALLPNNAIPASVVTINLAGERLKQSLVDQIFQCSKVQRVYDLYGPSEDTVYSTCARRSAHGIASIGRPIDHKEVFILDKNLNPAPVGIPGELFIGGKGLARGYLKRPGLTAEKFVAHPFREGIAVRVYRTGDLARYLSDGNIEFIGRLDNQIKLRGFRIELGEVESALEKHPQVREAVTVVRNDANGYEQLVAFVLPQGNPDPAESDLLHALRNQLPTYLVPLRVLIVDEFPLTPNGKIDREALPGLNDSSVELTSIHKKPRTPMEKALVSIWLEVLNVDDIGVDDNFFELGGHSLIATQVISRIRDRLGVELPLIKLFEYPTIAGMACVAEEVQQLDEPLVV